MTIQARPPHGRDDDDGVRVESIARGRRVFWLVALAVALPVMATLVAVAVIRFGPAEDARPATPVVARADVDPRAASAAAVARERPGAVASPAAGRVVPRRLAEPGPVPPGTSPVPEPQKPRREIDAADAIRALREEGVHEGIAAFGIPGTDPPKAGIIVPEDYVLPEGYVRHYQSTDDGEQLPAILMFHPDYEFVDEHGKVLPVPENRVVPPELAPPGLAVDNVLDPPERKAGEPVH